MRLTQYNEKLSFLNLGVQSDFLDIRAAGIVEPDENYQSGDIPLGYTLIEFIIDGRAKIKCGEAVCEPARGDLLMIRPGELPFTYVCDAKHPQRKLWITLRGRYLDSLFSLYELDDTLNMVSEPECYSYMESMIGFVSEYGIHENKLCHILFDLFDTAYTDKRAELEPPLSEQIRNVLDRHIEKPVKISDIAAYFCKSPRHIERVFERAFGVTVYKYLRDRRFAAACRELRYSDELVYVIAERFQLGSPGFLAKEFAKRYGMTPSEYRRRFRNSDNFSAGDEPFGLLRTIYDSIYDTTAQKKPGSDDV